MRSDGQLPLAAGQERDGVTKSLTGAERESEGIDQAQVQQRRCPWIGSPHEGQSRQPCTCFKDLTSFRTLESCRFHERKKQQNGCAFKRSNTGTLLHIVLADPDMLPILRRILSP